jgi:Flp pilus assembly protein TadG
MIDPVARPPRRTPDRSPRRPNRARGQAMAEFAMVAPIFFLLLFSIIELGILFGGQNGLVSSARELARYAAPFRVATNTDATNVCANAADPNHGLSQQLTGFLRQALPGYAAANVASRTVTYSWHPNPDGTYYVELEIRVAYRYPLYVPLVGGIIDRFDGVTDGKFMLDATEQMRIENEGLANTYSNVSCTI